FAARSVPSTGLCAHCTPHSPSSTTSLSVIGQAKVGPRTSVMVTESATQPNTQYAVRRYPLPLMDELGPGEVGGYEPLARGVADQFAAARPAELALEARAVRLDRAHAEDEPLGDLGVGVADGQQTQDLALARRELLG